MLPGDEADGQLVARVQQGDKRAFEVLVLKYRHRIFSLVSRFVRDPDEVQDVVQEAFIKAYRAIGGFRGESAFYTWLYRIAANTAKNHLVSRSRRPPGADLEVEDAEQLDAARALRDIEDPESLMMAEQLREAVEGAIRRLPEDLRTALMLREFEGLSYEEIAEVMACPVGTVRSRIFRAREAVDQEILPLMPGN
ncbi:MAG: RNA polymerase sigma factor RpoE [Gammaproteobacteria bacterium]